MVSYRQAYSDAFSDLRKAGVENARFEVNWIFKTVFGRDFKFMSTIFIERGVPAEKLSEFERIVSKRCAHYPLQYLLGSWEFYGCEFYVGEGVLIPRQETELLVDIALRHECSTFPPKILDLCAGTGCVGISVCRNMKCSLTSVDISDTATEYIKMNARLNGVENRTTVINADILDSGFAASLPRYDIILANPPYLNRDEMENLQTELTFEPALALDGGADGLKFYRAMFALWSEKLYPGGIIAVEVGDTQASEVADFMRANGLKPVIHKDLSGTERVVAGKAQSFTVRARDDDE